MKTFIAIIALTASLSASALDTIKGSVEIGLTNNLVSVSIRAEAARIIFDQLQNTREVVEKFGRVTATVKHGRDVTCYKFDSFTTSYACEFKINDTGAVIK